MFNEYEIKKGYFRGKPRFGRTTILVRKLDQERVYSVMGVCGKKKMVEQYLAELLLKKESTRYYDEITHKYTPEIKSIQESLSKEVN